jgi:hypothetical protein
MQLVIEAHSCAGRGHVWTRALASAMVSDRTRAGGCRMRGRGSAGRASPCQGEGRGFESRRPLGASLAQSQWGAVFPGGVAERRGNGLQIRVHGFKSRLHLGRLAQWERASLTRKRSLVQIQYRPPASPLVSEAFVRVWRWARLTCRPNCVGLSLAVLPSFVRFRFMLYEQRIHGRGSLLNAGLSSLRYTFSVTFVLPPGTEGANRGRPVRVRRRTGVWSAAPAVAPDVRRGTAGWTGRGIAVPRPARPTRCR